jgi:hypothetical protein
VTRSEPLVTIATFPTSFEASLARGALDAIGIEASVPGETLGTFSRKRGGIALTELQVFQSDRDGALVELRRLQMDVAEPPPRGQPFTMKLRNIAVMGAILLMLLLGFAVQTARQRAHQLRPNAPQPLSLR